MRLTLNEFEILAQAGYLLNIKYEGIPPKVYNINKNIKVKGAIKGDPPP